MEELSGVGNLKLFNEVLHEPVGVGAIREPEMTLTWHIDPSLWSRNLVDILLGLRLGADNIVSSDEEGHRYRVNLGDIHNVRVFVAS